MDYEDKLFGDYIRNARESFKLTQAQLAKKIGVNTHTISNWECGLYLPPPQKTTRLARIFGVSQTDVMKVRAQAKYQKHREEFEKQGTHIIPAAFQDFGEEAKKPKIVRPWQAKFIPLLDSRVKQSPEIFFDKPESWKGEWFGVDLIPVRMFGFSLLDKSMEPEFRQNSIIICDKYQRVVGPTCKVLLKIKNSPPLFRNYVKQGNQIIIRPINPNFPVQVIKKTDIEWIYPATKSILNIY